MKTNRSSLVLLTITIVVFLASVLGVDVTRTEEQEQKSLAELWAKLNAVFKASQIDSLRKTARDSEPALSPKGAAWIIENAAVKWKDSRYVGALAGIYAPRVARLPEVFAELARKLVDMYPESPCSFLIEPYLRGRERLVGPDTEWVKNYLTRMSGARVGRCQAKESRNCGIFGRNLAWAIKSWPSAVSKLSPWIVSWADRLRDSGSAGSHLKYAYARFFLAALMMVAPEDSGSFPEDKEMSRALASLYASIRLSDRLEVIEYYLWYYRIGDNLKRMPEDLKDSLRWIIEFITVTDPEECSLVIKSLIATESFRTLSLIWQFNICSPRVTRADTIAALENNVPLCFAVYLAHGDQVKRHLLRTHDLSRLYRLMLSIIPKKKGGQLQWNPCRERQGALNPYIWVPPFGISDISAQSIMILARFLLYIQFGIPFDDTRTDAALTGQESLDWAELPGAATTLLERYCQLRKQFPAYRIAMQSFGGGRFGYSSASDETADSTFRQTLSSSDVSSASSSTGEASSSILKKAIGAVDDDDMYAGDKPDDSQNLLEKVVHEIVSTKANTTIPPANTQERKTDGSNKDSVLKSNVMMQIDNCSELQSSRRPILKGLLGSKPERRTAHGLLLPETVSDDDSSERIRRPSRRGRRQRRRLSLTRSDSDIHDDEWNYANNDWIDEENGAIFGLELKSKMPQAAEETVATTSVGSTSILPTTIAVA